jgi:excisionase family DNA binding protein
MKVLDPIAPLRLALDEVESAKALGISTSTLREYVRDGRLRRVKFGRATRFLITDLQALAESLREPLTIDIDGEGN